MKIHNGKFWSRPVAADLPGRRSLLRETAMAEAQRNRGLLRLRQAAIAAVNALEPIMETNTTSMPPKKSRRGFAAMDEKKQKQIASMGGRAAHERGQAHEFTSDEARDAGRRGGQTVSKDRAHMAAIGKKGGVERGRRQRHNVQ